MVDQVGLPTIEETDRPIGSTNAPGSRTRLLAIAPLALAGHQPSSSSLRAEADVWRISSHGAARRWPIRPCVIRVACMGRQHRESFTASDVWSA